MNSPTTLTQVVSFCYLGEGNLQDFIVKYRIAKKLNINMFLFIFRVAYPFLFSVIISVLLYINFVSHSFEYNWLLIPFLFVSIIIFLITDDVCEEIEDYEHECSVYGGMND